MDRELADRIEKVQPLEIEGDAHRLIGGAPRAALRIDSHPAPDAGNAELAEVLDEGAVPPRGAGEFDGRHHIRAKVFLERDHARHPASRPVGERSGLRPHADDDFAVPIGHESGVFQRQSRWQGDARAGKLELDPLPGPAQLAGQQIERRRADEGGDEEIDRSVVKLPRRAHLLQDPVAHHRDPVGHRHRLDLIVRHIDRRDARGPLQPGDLDPHLTAQAGVEIGERLVHQKRPGVTHQRPSHRDALALSSRELARAAREQRLKLEHRRRFADAGFDQRARLLADLERESQVLGDAEVGIERIALEDHRDVAQARRQVIGERAADREHALGDRLEPSDHAQRRRFAAPGRSDQNQEFAVLDLQIEVFDRRMAARVDLAYMREAYCGHGATLLTISGRPGLNPARNND